MKQLSLLTITLLLTLATFSQTGTVRVIKDTGRTTLPTSQVRKMIKDVIAGDACAEEVKHLRGTLAIQEERLLRKDSLIKFNGAIIGFMNSRLSYYKNIDSLYLIKFNSYEQSLAAKDRIILSRDRKIKWQKLKFRGSLLLLAGAAAKIFIFK